MKPIILMTHKPESDPHNFGVGSLYGVRSNYCRAIVRAGGIPVMTLAGDAEDYAEIAGIEMVHINKETTMSDF